MKKGIMGAVFLLLFFLLQCSVFRWFAISNIGPNLLLILTCTYGFAYGEKEGLIMGFAAGLLCDIFFGTYLGVSAIIYMYIGYINGKFSRLFYPEDVLLPGTLFLTSDFFYGTVYYLILFLLRGRFQFGFYFMNIILPEVIYTLIVAVVFYPLLLVFINLLEKNERRGSRKFV